MAEVFEKLIPGLAELRARERRNRAIAFQRLTRTVCGLELRALTPADRLDLQNLGNAFTIRGLEALEGDVFVFLWILHPKRRKAGGLLATLANNVRQWRLRRHVKRLQLEKAKREIRLFLLEQIQDLPELATGEESGFDQSPWVHWIAADASFWMNKHGGFTLETYLSTPYLVLQQLYRGWRINNPSYRLEKGELVPEDPQFINRSDEMIGQWHASRRDEIAAIIRSRKTRLN